MAFDQNSIPKDLRPLNIARTIADEPCIAAATPAAVSNATSTTGRNPDSFANPDGSIPVIYPQTVSESGFVGVAYGNPSSGISTWIPRVPLPVPVQVQVPVGSGNVSAVGYGYGPNFGNKIAANAVDHASADLVAGYGYTPNLGNRVIANGSSELSNSGCSCSPSLGNRASGCGTDQGSEDGGDDSVSGKKVKFLCSFGGKILPRPSDGMLRYVGGQTRIISVRRDVSFTDLLRKMMDVCGQPVVIKYQLPDEDLDALVSISCSDDLDNMMDEYEKLVERSSDGSAKLRVFLFSASQLDASGLVQYGDLQDSGQKYVEAVNGIVDGVTVGITRKESIASATSTQNSDFSGSENVDNSGHGQGDVIGLPSTSKPSPRGYSVTSCDNSAKIVPADPTPPIVADVSAVSLGVPMVKSSPSQSLYSQPQVEFERSIPVAVPKQQMGYDFQQAGIGIPAHASHLQAFVDPRQEILNHADYTHLPPQSGFPNTHLVGTTGSVFMQQNFRDSNTAATPHQFIPAVHMTMNQSSSHANVTPTVVQPLVQHQQTQLEHYRDENTFGTRIVQLPVEARYNAYQAQLMPTNVGGYSWRQVPQSEHVVFSDGLVAQQQVIIPNRIPRLEDCYLCHKALPHAHSDSLAQDQSECGASPLSDSNSVYHSLQLEDTMKARTGNRVLVTGALGEGIDEQVAGAPAVLSHIDPQVGIPQPDALVFSHNLGALHDDEKTANRKLDNSDQPKISVSNAMLGLPSDAPSPYGIFTGGIPPPHLEDSVHQPSVPTQYQETLLWKPLNNDVLHTAALPIQAPEHLVHESTKEYFGKPPRSVSKEAVGDPPMSHEQLRPVGGMMESPQICHSETNMNNEENKSPVTVFRKDDILDHRAEQIGGTDNTFINPKVVLDHKNIKPTEVVPAYTELSYVHSSRPVESYEVVQPPVLNNPTSYPQNMVGHPLDSPEVGPGIPGYSVGEPTYVTDRILHPAERKNDCVRLQSNNVPNGAEASSTISASSFSPSSRVGDIQDSSNSLFSNQDPWSLRNDTHFPPPRPFKISTKKELLGTRDPLGENHLNNAGDLIKDLVDGETQVLRNPNKDAIAENSRSSKGSAEELIRQELQAVAEGVAASVFMSSSTNPDACVHERNESYEANRENEASNKDIELQHKAKLEEMKNKLPEKANLRFPVSEGIGRLQIIKNSDLEELRELGSGTFGTVYHGKWRGTDVAIKRINDRCFAGKPSEQDRMIDDFWNEAIKLAELHHPNVVAFYGVVLDGPGGSVATVTEYMVNGSLRNALQKNERNLDKRKRLLIAMDVAFGMEYLHGKNIVHFDLKSDNLLVNLRDPHRPICKVGDLGLSKVKCQTLISGGVRGTLPWMAPELLNGSSSLVSEKVDVFSFGIVLWELLTGEEPYADLHYGAIIGGIVSNTLRPMVPESCDPEWRSLMERCWSSEPSDRPNFTEIANHLRAMASKIPPKGQSPAQQLPSAHPQTKK